VASSSRKLVLVALLDKEKQRFNREYANGQRNPIRAAEDAFDPENVQVLVSALDEACARLRRLNNIRLERLRHSSHLPHSDEVRKDIAKRIMMMAKRGGKDEHALAVDAVQFVTAKYKQLSESRVSSETTKEEP
jgi:hypothetical protein